MSNILEKSIEIINRLGIKDPGTPVTIEEIAKSEERLGVRFPDSYRVFLSKFGTFQFNDIVVFGLGVPRLLLPSVECATLTARAIHPDLPPGLIPIHLIENGVFACISPDPVRNTDEEPPLVIWYATLPTQDQSWETLDPSFGHYFCRLVQKPYWHDKGFQILKEHVARYQKEHEYDHAKGGKLPRNTDWRPFRYCIQDVVFGTTVVKHHQEGNCLQVDVFLTADVPEYGPMAGARALTAFLLSEAYKCGGTMEIRFTRNVEDGQVPAELQELAFQYGIHLSHVSRGRIEPGESKALYAAMTGFSGRLQEHINQLESEGKLKMARACYVVHHGVWSKEQLEMIVLGSENPESILSGQARPEQRHLYQHDLLHARAALMAGMFERMILQRNRVNEEGVTFDMEDDLRELKIHFDGTGYVKEYLCSEPVALPWLFDTKNDRTIPENIAFQVLVRARSQADLRFHFPADIQTAAKWKAEKNAPTFILVPRDFTEMPGNWMAQVAEKAEQAGIGILVCPESVAVFDVEAAQRLSTSRVLRQ